MKVQLVVAFVFCKKDKEDRTRNYLQIFPATAILNFSLNDSLMSKDRIRCIDFKCPCEVHILLYKSEPSLSVQSSKSIFFLIFRFFFILIYILILKYIVIQVP